MGVNNYEAEYSLSNRLIKIYFLFSHLPCLQYLNSLTCTILLVGKILSSGNGFFFFMLCLFLLFFPQKQFYLFIYLFYFTILYWFCHTSTCIRHGCTCVLHPEPPSRLPPCTIPLGHPSAPAPSFLYLASNLDWRFISYMILYMF